jgi:hypothetical protein
MIFSLYINIQEHQKKGGGGIYNDRRESEDENGSYYTFKIQWDEVSQLPNYIFEQINNWGCIHLTF